MAQNEIQTLQLFGSPTGGTCDIVFDGQTASGVAYNASAATVESALEALSNIGAGNVSCSGGPWPGSTIACEFVSSLAGTALPEMTIDPSGLTGGSISMSVVETNKGGEDLTTSLEAYWPCDEPSGDLLDSHNSYDLAESGTLGTDSGVVSTARSIAGTGYFYLSGAGNIALWEPKRTRTYAGWVYSSNVASDLYLSSSFSATVYFRLYTISGNVFFDVLDTTGSHISVQATTFGAISTNTWYYISCDMDSSTGEIGISINGQRDSATVTNGINIGGGAATLRLGASQMRVDEWSLWDGRVLTTSELNALYNAGAGRAYSSLGSGGDEIQTISTSGSPSDGSFVLSYSGYSAQFDYDATASEVQTGLQGLAPIGTDNLTCSGGPLPGSPIAATFTSSLSDTDVDPLIVDYDLLLYKVVTTQDGSPTPSQASAAWSAGPFVYSAIDASASADWTAGNVTASGNPEQVTGAWSTSSLQSPGIPSSTLPTAQWSSGTVSSAVLTQATATWSAGTPVLPGVFSGPAIAKWRAVQFAVLPDNPVIASWSTSEIDPDNNPVNVPTATWSSSNAIATAVVDDDPTATWSTGELTTDLNLGLPTTSWSSATLSPPLTQASTQWTVPGSIGVRLISAPAYVGTTTFRIIDQNLQVISLAGESVTTPDLTSGTLTIPKFTGQAIAAPGLTSGSLIS